MTMKLWAGRFQKETDDIGKRLQLLHLLRRSALPAGHRRAPSPTPPCWAEQGIIAKDEAEKIIARRLKSILADIEAGKVEFSMDSEDIHMNMEVAADPAHRRHRQAAAHRPQPERSGGAWTSVCM